MPFVTTRRRAPARRRRLNPFTSRTARKAALIRWGKSPVKRRKARRKGYGKGRRYGIHRPRLRWGKRGWMAVPRGSVKRGTRINRRRRIRRTRRNTVARYNPRRAYRRRNPAASRGLIKSLTNRQTLGTALSIGGGLVAGSITMPLLTRILPSDITVKYNKCLGLANVLAGVLMFSFMKNRMLKQLGLVIAGTGMYDLVASNVTDLQLPMLPRSSAFINKLLPPPAGTVAPNGTSASYPIARQPVSAAARYGAPFAASYQQPFGASYQSPMPIEGFGGDSPYSGVEGWE